MTFGWYEDAMIFCVFVRVQLFLFRTNGKKGEWITMASLTVMIFFSQVGYWMLPDQSCSKFILSNYETHWHQHFERCPTIEYWTWISVRVKSFIKNSVNIIKQKSDLAVQRTLHQSIPRFTYFILFLFPQT